MSKNTYSTKHIASEQQDFIFRSPNSTDGLSVHNLVKRCPPLDPNSVYCNLLQCGDFSESCVVCEIQGEIVAFMTGYIKPQSPDTLFCWQMAVDEQFRGRGLAGRLLSFLVEKINPRFIETTVTDNNPASISVFQAFAQRRDIPIKKSLLFDRDEHFAGEHESEMLYRIGPIYS